MLLIVPSVVFGQRNLEKIIGDSLTKIAAKYAQVGRITVLPIQPNIVENSITVSASDALSYIPFRPENVERIYAMLSTVTKQTYPDFKISCVSDRKRIEDLIPNYFLKENKDKTRIFDNKQNDKPFIVNLSRPYQSPKGLYNKHIAVWQSHGLFYNQSQQKWVFQRSKLFQTVEDLFTQSYVLPFLVPMLENAGANIFLPRERDTQRNEVIIDNDDAETIHRYREYTDRKKWTTNIPGFGSVKSIYFQGENPFLLGSYQSVEGIDKADDLSYAEWVPSIPEDGMYAVYVSFKTVKNSAPDARYTVYHLGGKTDFKVNQTMGGGTWVYLGHFKFVKGKYSTSKVVLSNYSSFKKKQITADAVKIGGGMGNIARHPFVDESTTKTIDTLQINKLKLIEPKTSTYPRYTEGARYWLQWAGVPDSVYSRTKGKNDYSDDFQSRGFWVNYIAGGSSVLPNQQGLNIPIDMAFAFHTDAGASSRDSLIGTLGICSVNATSGSQTFANGVSRWASRDLTDLIQTQIADDLRKTHAPEWVRRGLWNKSYSESRTPEVPTMLLELLSHQNFADMRYGLDPRFKFTVSRAIYKGILRFIYGDSEGYVVQPLPVSNFHLKFLTKTKLQLAWKPVIDNIEPTATPTKYVLYTRVDDNGFNNGQVVADTKIILDLQPGNIYSFKIAALNDGGESFPSEILSAYRANSSNSEMLIINGFDRVSAPVSFTKNNSAGFDFDSDPGVPYLNEYSFIGKQFEFNRSKQWKSEDEPGFGGGFSNFADKLIVGNTFDYTFIHGKSIKAAGHSFVSSSLQSVLQNDIELKNFQTVDLILGKQKKTLLGNGKKGTEFKTFPLALQQHLKSYLLNGGNLLVSGAYIGSDMLENGMIPIEEKLFIESVLKFKFKTANASLGNSVTVVPSPFLQFGRTNFSYYNQPNDKSIFVESVDAIEPTGGGAVTIARYKGTNNSAAVAYFGKYKCCSFGFPFETIESEKERNRLMNSILNFFNTKKINTQLFK